MIDVVSQHRFLCALRAFFIRSFPEYVCGIFIFHQLSIKSVAFVETVALV